MQATPLSLPHSYLPAARAASNESYLRHMGHRWIASEGTLASTSAPSVPGQSSPPLAQSPSQGKWESTDQVANRLQGYLLFLAALLQSGHNREGTHALIGLDAAWRWLARYI